jgi:hypothetical protein
MIMGFGIEIRKSPKRGDPANPQPKPVNEMRPHPEFIPTPPNEKYTGLVY